MAQLSTDAANFHAMNVHNAENHRKLGKEDAGELDFAALVYGTLRMILQDAINDTETAQLKFQIGLEDMGRGEEPA